MLFDTHAHLNFKIFDGIVDEVVREAKKAGVEKILVPGTDLASSGKAVEIAGKHEAVYAAVGIHPHHTFGVNDTQNMKYVTQEIKKLEEIIESNVIARSLRRSNLKEIVAIGEIGLDRHQYQHTKYQDYSVGEKFFEIQKIFFIEQLKLAIKYKKAVIVHNRETTEEILEILRDSWDGWFEGHMVFHCCEPDGRLLEYAIKHHIYIGVDGDVTYSKDKQTFIKKVPPDFLVLETDSPFLAPIVNGKKLKFPNTPANLLMIAEFIAKLKGLSCEEIMHKTTENARHLFSL